MTKRWSNGKYRHQPYTGGLKLLVVLIGLGASIQWLYTPPTVPISPLVGYVEAGESKPRQSTPAPTNQPVEAIVEPSSPIEDYIDEVFGEYGEDAKKIAKCESGLDPTRIGDKDLISYNGDEIVGDSIGLFQIRTGGKEWNRAKANGMTAQVFRDKLKDPKYNIDYAKTIFDRSGKIFGKAWVLCSKRTGVK